MTIEIRPAVPSDAAQILTFITELAEYEKARHEVIASVADIEQSVQRGRHRPWPDLLAGRPADWLCGVLFQLFHMVGQQLPVPRRPLHQPRTARRRGGQEIAAPPGKNCLRQRLRTFRMERAGLERAGDRLLQVHRRATAGRMGALPHGRRRTARFRPRLKPAPTLTVRLRKIPHPPQSKCGSGLAREGGVSVTTKPPDPPPSQASQLPPLWVTDQNLRTHLNPNVGAGLRSEERRV